MPSHHHALCQHHDGFSLPGAGKQYPPDLGLEPIHTHLEARVDVVGKYVEGAVTHTVLARRPGVRELVLNAVDLEVRAVEDVSGNELDWSYDGSTIGLTWRTPVEQAGERRVRITYRVDQPSAGLYFSGPSAPYPDTPLYAATDHETERARHWLPCVDLPSVRPKLDIVLTAEDRFTILANGRLVSEQAAGEGWKTAHWSLDFPCPSYLTCFCVGDLVRADDREVNGVPIAYFTTRDHSAEDLMRSFGRTPDMLAWLTKKLDRPLPFPKYYQFALPGFTGAMENISVVSWNDLYVADATFAAEFGYLIDAVNIHEMAHSYFGDAIVIRDYAHAWLKESWAVYIEQCWWEDEVSADEAMYDYFTNADSYFGEADGRYMRPIVTRQFASSWEMYDRHLYPGGACRLHTLRHLMGDTDFWTGVREYVRRFEGRIVETEDFRRVMEEVSGRSLVAFFDQWIYGKGYPSLKVTFAYKADKRQGTFTVEQTQVNKEKGIEAFDFEVDLAWSNADGALERRTVHITDAKHTFVVPMDSDPQAVRVDPDARVLHKLDFNPGAERLRRQLTSAPDLIGRILAARELVKAGGDRNIAAVLEAYKKEPFWGVRVRMAEALGGSGSQAAARVLAEVVANESDPKVLRHVFMAAAKYRDAGLARAVEDRFARGLPYLAGRMALEALGAQRQDAPYDLLLAEASRTGWGGQVQSGAFTALAGTRRPEAIEVLVAATKPGAVTNKARPTALTALADIGKVLEGRHKERAREALVDGLRDDVPAVRHGALAGLRTLGDRAAIGALESYQAGLSHQERVGVDHAIAAIRKAAKPAAKVGEAEIEEMRSDLKKLREAVDTLRAKVEPEDAAVKGATGKPKKRDKDKNKDRTKDKGS